MFNATYSIFTPKILFLCSSPAVNCSMWQLLPIQKLRGGSKLISSVEVLGCPFFYSTLIDHPVLFGPEITNRARKTLNMVLIFGVRMTTNSSVLERSFVFTHIHHCPFKKLISLFNKRMAIFVIDFRDTYNIACICVYLFLRN